jgi:hypothetical protein
MTRLLISLFFVSALDATSVSFAQVQDDCGIYPEKRITPLVTGSRVDWARTHGLIAYDAQRDAKGQGRDLFFRLRVMRIETSPVVTVVEDHCLTCGGGRPRGVRKHAGNPAWHPLGEYIVFQALIPDSDALDKVTYPGRGVDNVLWLTDRQGTRFWQLTSPYHEPPEPPEPPAPEMPGRGVLHPHFSPNGQWLSWSEMYRPGDPDVEGQAFGHWQLKIAQLKLDEGRPHLDLANARTFRTEIEGFYENHGFSPDGSKVLFSSNIGRTGLADRLNNDIFTVELTPEYQFTDVVRQHTSRRYNEHAHYTPSGEKIFWISNRGNLNLGTDLWIMPADSTAEAGQRITAFNQLGCAESPPKLTDRRIAADSSINAAGDKILLYVQDEILGEVGTIQLIEIPSPF